MHNLTLDTSEQHSGFALMIGDAIGKIEFLSAPIEDAFIGSDDSSASFLIRPDIRGTVFQESDSRVLLTASRNTIFPISFSARLTGFEFVDSTPDKMTLKIQDQDVTLELSGGTFEFSTLDHVKINMKGALLEMKAYIAKDFSSLSFEKLSLDVPEIHGPLDCLPEFSIGVFDAYNPTAKTFSRPRPLRLGVPVISTLPTQGDDLTQDEIDFIELGVPAEERTMHFRVVSNRLLESGLVSGDLSELKLKLWLPTGLDTVGLPTTVPLYFLGTDTELGQAGPAASQMIYRTSYTFKKEDTIKSVDGFMYLSVYVPLTVQIGLPVMFRVSGTGSPAAPFEEPIQTFAVQE